MARPLEPRGRLAGIVVVATMMLAVASPLQGRQAVQATASIAREVNQEYRMKAAARAAQWVAAFSETLARDGVAGSQAAPLLLSGLGAAEDILTYTGDVWGLVHLVERLERVVSSQLVQQTVDAVASNQDVQETPDEARRLGIASPPQLFAVNESVVFALGLGARYGEKSTGHVSLGTNLLGSALSSALDAFGAGGLGDYLKANISAGPVFPVGGGGPSGQLGVGLGEVRVRSVSFWPVLSVTELKSDDSSVPEDVSAEVPGQAVWSYPSVGLGVVRGSESFNESSEDRGVGFVVSVGVTLPFYYPGGVGSALEALFSDSRGDYVQSGGIGAYLEISIPLFQVKRQEGS